MQKIALSPRDLLLAYWELCKPRVVLLMLITAYVGMQLAVPGVVPIILALWALVGIGLMAGSAATINHILDEHLDRQMARTRFRPLPTGKLTSRHAFIFAVFLGSVGFLILSVKVNLLTAFLTLLTLLGYAVIYTAYLKRATSQNIVLGGLAGAMPPLLGWTAITGSISLNPLILVAIIFIWTPPHFWALAIYRYEEYRKIKHIPMLPITHGIPTTKIYILLYTILLLPTALLPSFIGMSGFFYGLVSFCLSAVFIYEAFILKLNSNPLLGRRVFRYSILYLFLLFIALFIDHYLPYPIGIA